MATKRAQISPSDEIKPKERKKGKPMSQKSLYDIQKSRERRVKEADAAPEYKNTLEGALSVIMRYDTISVESLRFYFPNYKGRLKRLLDLLQYVCYSPYRYVEEISRGMSAVREYVKPALAYLCGLGYCCMMKKPRLIKLFGAYTMTNVYMCTLEGKRVLRNVYEAAGIM